jgi:hypothetical protein
MVVFMVMAAAAMAARKAAAAPVKPAWVVIGARKAAAPVKLPVKRVN